MKRVAAKFLLFFSLIAMMDTLSSLAFSALYSGFPEMQQSKAYQQFIMRPVSDNSKLIYLIDRFGDTDAEIVYDGHYFSAPFVARVARWFLGRHYKNEPAEKWVMRWCNTSIGGQLIWVKLPSGKFRLSREILLEELEQLEKAVEKERRLSAGHRPLVPGEREAKAATIPPIVSPSPSAAS